MYNRYSWLPERIEFDDYDGNWFKYLDAIYKIYLNTLVLNRSIFKGKIVYTIKEPQREDKEETFWHIIEGRKEDKCETDFNRCSCIPWIRPTIECVKREDIVWWIEKITKSGKRRNIKRLHIMLNDFSYLVVLNVREKCFILITAYPIESNHTRSKYERRYKKWAKKMTPP